MQEGNPVELFKHSLLLVSEYRETLPHPAVRSLAREPSPNPCSAFFQPLPLLHSTSFRSVPFGPSRNTGCGTRFPAIALHLSPSRLVTVALLELCVYY